MNAESIKERSECLGKCIQSALKSFELPHEDLLSVRLWEQQFSNLACGFPGISGQAITRAVVIIITKTYCISTKNGFTMRVPGDGSVRIYIDGRFAYGVKKPNAEFYKAVESCHIGEAARYNGQYEDQT